jgi:hypothetical protein
MREILPELEQRCESLNRMARNWKRVTGNPETIDHAMLVVRSRQASLGPTLSNLRRGVRIRMIAGLAGIAERKEILVAGARYVPNAQFLSIPFRSELIHCAT